MKTEKGLCVTCDNKKTCIFLKDKAVILCEEFSDDRGPCGTD